MENKNVVSLYSPFIPSDKFADFNVSLWAGLISGVVAGIFTGIIVGWIIWKIQSRHENIEQQKQCEREVSIFIQQLKVSLQSSTAYFRSSNPSRCLPSNIVDTIDLIVEKPINYWVHNLKDTYIRELKLLLDVVNIFLIFKKASSILEPAVQYYLLKQFDELNYSYYIPSFYGILNGHDIDELKLYQQIPSLSNERIEIIREIIENTEIKPLSDEYTRCRTKLIDKVIELSSFIGT
jgi:hypothetical protein